ncbi:MAG TPA: MgtC/SapB family protein [Fibrobacteraceae bacterium]|nr:MgtC/SapB family protein [Fibrobacteraceae bacterium]
MMTDLVGLDVFGRFAVALALGFVVGLQRENASDQEHSTPLAGVRTFPIVSLLGCGLAWLGITTSSMLPFSLGLLVIGAVLVTPQLSLLRAGQGTTTLMALLLAYTMGGICAHGHLILATSLAVALTLLLTLKVELHSFAHKLTRNDMVASLKFAVISAVVLPLLPDRYYGPLQVFNPFTIWLMVVFISGIGFIGYLLVKLVGANRGIGLTGFMGGLASSTALTLSFTQRSRQNPALSSSLATGIVVAWTVMYIRVLGVVWALSPALGHQLALPMLVPVFPGLLWCLWLWRRGKTSGHQTSPEYSNPFELVPAIKFVGILLVVMLISKLAHQHFGDSGLLISSFLAGLADVDAIAISVSQMSVQDLSFPLPLAATSVVFAGIANTLTKGIIAILFGAPEMRRAIAPAMALMIASGVLAVFVLRMG